MEGQTKRDRWGDPRHAPKTGARCSCKRGVQRDNCPACEGTGFCIEFGLIMARRNAPNLADLDVVEVQS